MIEFSTSERLYTLLFRTAHIVRRCSDSTSALPPGQLRALALLCSMENPTQQKILEQLHIRPASLSELLTKLEKGGYIIRTRDEKDKRNVLITVTEKGKQANKENYGKQKDNALEAFKALSEKEKNQLLELLKKVMLSLDDNDEK